jgi:hypothetical protein
MIRFVLPLFLMFAACDDSSSSDDDDDKSSAEESLEDGEKLKDGKADDAVEFNDGIVGLQTAVMIPWEAYSATSDPEKERKHLAETKKACKEALKTLDKVKPYSGGKDLQDSAEEMFEAFMEFIEMNETMLDLRDAEDFEKWAEFEPKFVAAEEKVNTKMEAFLLSQQLYAISNNLSLEDSVELPDPEED